MERDESQLVRGELERIFSSECFARNERLKSFLRYVVEEELAGRGDQLKEALVGFEVFGRKADYDVRQDSVVRTEAARLRFRLTEYYAKAGAADPLVIELPKGGYKPVFKQVQLTAATPGPTRAPLLSRPRWRVLGVACAALLVLAAGVWLLRNRDRSISIAVLPLVNMSSDSSSDYFADGLTGEIIRNLSIIDGLVVRSQTSSFAFKGNPKNIREAGRQLAAEYILEGSVFRSAEHLRINAHLIRVRDDFPLWSGRYEREVNDVFVIQDEISRGIVNSLRLKLGRGRRRYETSTEAYDLYLRARALEARSAADGRNRSFDSGFYQQAIASDPSFAPAYAGLAAAYAYRSGEDRVNWAGSDRAQDIARMRAVVAKAIELDPLLAEAYAALGMVQARDALWEQSEKSFRRAIDLDPNRSFTRMDFASNLLMPLGRIQEAVAQVRLAQKSDPLSRGVQDLLAIALFSAGRFEEAVAACASPCTRAMIFMGKPNQAIPILEARFNGRLDRSGAYELGIAYARAGRREDAERIAGIQQNRPVWQAMIFATLGDKDRAIEALDRAIPMGPVRIGRNLYYPEFLPLRGDPRLKVLRKKIALPE